MFENDLGSYSSSSSDNLEDNITKSCLAINTNNGNDNAVTGTFNHDVCSKTMKLFMYTITLYIARL